MAREKTLGTENCRQKVLTSIRCKVEHVFHRIKVRFRYKKADIEGWTKYSMLNNTGLDRQYVHWKLLRHSNQGELRLGLLRLLKKKLTDQALINSSWLENRTRLSKIKSPKGQREESSVLQGFHRYSRLFQTEQNRHKGGSKKINQDAKNYISGKTTTSIILKFSSP